MGLRPLEPCPRRGLKNFFESSASPTGQVDPWPSKLALVSRHPRDFSRNPSSGRRPAPANRRLGAVPRRGGRGVVISHSCTRSTNPQDPSSKVPAAWRGCDRVTRPAGGQRAPQSVFPKQPSSSRFTSDSLPSFCVGKLEKIKNSRRCPSFSIIMFHEAGRTPYSKQLQTLVRYDLLCLEGLARALRVFTGSEAIPVYRLASILCGSMLQMHVKPQEWSMEAGICCCGGGDDSSGGWRRRGPGSRDGAASLVQATWRAACVGVGVLHEAADDVPRHPLLAHLQLSSPTRSPPSSSSRGRRRGRQSRAPDCTAPQSRL